MRGYNAERGAFTQAYGSDVLEIVGSCGAESAEDEIETIRAIQDSVGVDLS